MKPGFITGLLSVSASILCALLLGGCAEAFQALGAPPDTNVLTYEHRFSDADLADAEARANRECAQRKQLAISTQRACTLEKCRSSFQCVKPEDKKAYGL